MKGVQILSPHLEESRRIIMLLCWWHMEVYSAKDLFFNRQILLTALG